MKVLQESILVDCLDRLEAGATVAEILAEYPCLLYTSPSPRD